MHFQEVSLGGERMNGGYEKAATASGIEQLQTTAVDDSADRLYWNRGYWLNERVGGAETDPEVRFDLISRDA